MWNAIFSGARLLTLGHCTVQYDQILELSKMPDSILYSRDVLNVDHQDDDTAFRLFCFSFLNQIFDKNTSLNKLK